MDPLALYNTFCRENDIIVFPPTPRNLHTCSPACIFYSISDKISICTTSRLVHTCNDQCPFLLHDETVFCSLTRRSQGARLDYRYYDGTTSFTPRRRVAQLNPVQVRTIIVTTITDLLTGKSRRELEENRNRRLARQELIAITKLARQKKLHRGNFVHYYSLFMAHSTRTTRHIPNKFNILALANCIYTFWAHLFPLDAKNPVLRTIIGFTTVCVAELAQGTTPIFPLIPWIAAAVPSQAHIYAQSNVVTCRSMTATLMQIINTVARECPGYTFPLG